MSEKELLMAIEEDARRECAAILENAQKETEAIIKEAEEEQARRKRDALENAKAFLESERIGVLAGARLYANEAILKQRQLAINRVLEGVSNSLDELRMHHDYPEILKRLFSEAVERWRTDAGSQAERPLVIVSKEDVRLLKGFDDISLFEIIADETGNMSPGVIIMGKDRRHRIINTLHSRLEKARAGLVTMIDRILWSEK